MPAGEGGLLCLLAPTACEDAEKDRGRLKRARSPPRRRGSPPSDRDAEYTATDDDIAAETRSKAYHDPRYATRTREDQPRKKRRVVDLSEGEEEEEQLQSPRGDDDELQRGFR